MSIRHCLIWYLVPKWSSLNSYNGWRWPTIVKSIKYERLKRCHWYSVQRRTWFALCDGDLNIYNLHCTTEQEEHDRVWARLLEYAHVYITVWSCMYQLNVSEYGSIWSNMASVDKYRRGYSFIFRYNSKYPIIAHYGRVWYNMVQYGHIWRNVDEYKQVKPSWLNKANMVLIWIYLSILCHIQPYSVIFCHTSI